MKRAALAAVALGLACCNANDVVLYGPAAAGAGDTTGDGAVGGTSASETGGSGAYGASGTSGDTSALGGMSTTGGAAGMTATGGTDTSGGGGAMAGSGGAEPFTLCHTNDDCSSTYYCSKATCGDDTGVCLPVPLFCDAKPAPVCGCDDVTYWNSCVRAEYGVSADRPDECGPQGALPPCMSDDDCGAPGLLCAHLLSRPGDMNCSDPRGTCWGIPLDCDPSDMDPHRWLPCDAGGMGSPMGNPPACVSTCEAIQSGGAYVSPPRGYLCP